ncbi:hypothetical protein BH20ACT23_BH20ACT23_23030 [soil metagenome]
MGPNEAITVGPLQAGVPSVPDGLFNFIDGTIRVLAAPQQSVDDLRRLRLIIEDARRTGADPSQLSATIEDQLPQLGALIRSLLIPRNAGEFYAFLSFLITAIMLVLALREQPELVKNINIERQVIQVFENCWQKDSSQKPPGQLPTDSKQKSPKNDEQRKPDP